MATWLWTKSNSTCLPLGHCWKNEARARDVAKRVWAPPQKNFEPCSRCGLGKSYKVCLKSIKYIKIYKKFTNFNIYMLFRQNIRKMLPKQPSMEPFLYCLNLTTSWSFLSVWMIQMKEQRFIMLATIDFSLCGQYGIPLRLPSHTAELLLDAAFLCNVVHTKNYIFFSLI